MTHTTITSAEANASGTSFITTTSGMAGWFAVHMWWNNESPDTGGFWEPYNSGFGRYKTKAEAEVEAKAWSESDEIPFLEN